MICVNIFLEFTLYQIGIVCPIMLVLLTQLVFLKKDLINFGVMYDLYHQNTTVNSYSSRNFIYILYAFILCFQLHVMIYLKTCLLRSLLKNASVTFRF